MSNADWDHEGQDTDSSLEDNFADRFVDEILSSRGGEFFCEVDEDYITDRFNLTGLSNEVDHFQIAYELVTDTWEDEGGTKELNIVHENSAKLLYGLIHARYILTPRGLQKMVSPYLHTILY
jgi:casein kinase II subunit beta